MVAQYYNYAGKQFRYGGMDVEVITDPGPDGRLCIRKPDGNFSTVRVQQLQPTVQPKVDVAVIPGAEGPAMQVSVLHDGATINIMAPYPAVVEAVEKYQTGLREARAAVAAKKGQSPANKLRKNGQI